MKKYLRSTTHIRLCARHVLVIIMLEPPSPLTNAHANTPTRIAAPFVRQLFVRLLKLGIRTNIELRLICFRQRKLDEILLYSYPITPVNISYHLRPFIMLIIKYTRSYFIDVRSFLCANDAGTSFTLQTCSLVSGRESFSLIFLLTSCFQKCSTV